MTIAQSLLLNRLDEVIALRGIEYAAEWGIHLRGPERVSGRALAARGAARYDERRGNGGPVLLPTSERIERELEKLRAKEAADRKRAVAEVARRGGRGALVAWLGDAEFALSRLQEEEKRLRARRDEVKALLTLAEFL